MFFSVQRFGASNPHNDEELLSGQSSATVKIVLIRKEKFDCNWLKAISPEIKLNLESREKIVLEQKPVLIAHHHKIIIYDCLATNYATPNDIQKLRKKCPEPDLVLYCTPLMDQTLANKEQNKIRTDDANTISFYSARYIPDNKQFWSKVLFVLSKGYVANEENQDLEKRISERKEYLEEHVKTCLGTNSFHIKHVVVENDLYPEEHAAPRWNEDLLHAMIECCENEKAKIFEIVFVVNALLYR